MASRIARFALPAIAALAASIAAPAYAVPALQLDIKGGSYDATTDTVMAAGNTFALYAYGLASGSDKVPLSDNYFLSIALLGAPSAGGNFGSFTINGQTIKVTSDMVWGVPPIESNGTAVFDSGDLSKHDIFPTYFTEVSFKFNTAQQSGIYDTEDHAGWGPRAGTGMYFSKFDVNANGLQAGQMLHFDLYNEKLIAGMNCTGSGKSKVCTPTTDIDAKTFAPFSHDAGVTVAAVTGGGGVTPPVPEPETYSMLLAGIGLIGAVARRRKQAA